MRTIDGFVCLVKVNEFIVFEVIFGPSVNCDGQSYENITSNDLKVFEEHEAAVATAKEMLARRKDFISITIGHLVMNMAESQDDYSALETESNLVVLQINDDFGCRDYRLIGDRSGDEARDRYANIYPLYGADLLLAGLTTIRSYDRAEEIAREVKRQGDSPAAIATFQLDRVGPELKR